MKHPRPPSNLSVQLSLVFHPSDWSSSSSSSVPVHRGVTWPSFNLQHPSATLSVYKVYMLITCSMVLDRSLQTSEWFTRISLKHSSLGPAWKENTDLERAGHPGQAAELPQRTTSTQMLIRREGGDTHTHCPPPQPTCCSIPQLSFLYINMLNSISPDISFWNRAGHLFCLYMCLCQTRKISIWRFSVKKGAVSEVFHLHLSISNKKLTWIVFECGQKTNWVL